MYKILVICLAVSGCGTIAPSTMNFPTPPELLMRPPLQLKPLPKPLEQITVSAKKTHKPFKRSKAGLESSQQLDED